MKQELLVVSYRGVVRYDVKFRNSRRNRFIFGTIMGAALVGAFYLGGIMEANNTPMYYATVDVHSLSGRVSRMNIAQFVQHPSEGTNYIGECVANIDRAGRIVDLTGTPNRTESATGTLKTTWQDDSGNINNCIAKVDDSTRIQSLELKLESGEYTRVHLR